MGDLLDHSALNGVIDVIMFDIFCVTENVVTFTIRLYFKDPIDIMPIYKCSIIIFDSNGRFTLISSNNTFHTNKNKTKMSPTTQFKISIRHIQHVDVECVFVLC